MARDAVKIKLAHMGSINRGVTALYQFIFDKGFEQAANDRTFGHPQNKARTHKIADGEKAKLFA